MNSTKKICRTCVLDSNYPGISFDENGICIHCTKHRKRSAINHAERTRRESRFVDLIEKNKGLASYDGLVAYSGGKDSTYLLDLLINTYKLRVLAFTFDNWYQSPRSSRNILAVTKSLNVDHINIRPRFETFKKIIQAAVAGDFFSDKALERASAVCTVCLSLIRHTALRLAIEMRIPFVFFGLSPGQSPISSAVFKTNPSLVHKMQSVILAPLLERIGDAVRPYFLDDLLLSRGENFPYIVNPLAFCSYNEEEILRRANRLGWEKPGDTDANSTNCLLNSLANEMHFSRFGINPYAYEIAELVRGGVLRREEALARLNHRPDKELISKLKAELGI
jgi:tRNA(Ile)-lysidine synthase TilS/MesJ